MADTEKAPILKQSVASQDSNEAEDELVEHEEHTCKHSAAKSSVSGNESSPMVTSESVEEQSPSRETRDHAADSAVGPVEGTEEKVNHVDHVESPETTRSVDEAASPDEEGADAVADNETDTFEDAYCENVKEAGEYMRFMPLARSGSVEMRRSLPAAAVDRRKRTTSSSPRRSLPAGPRSKSPARVFRATSKNGQVHVAERCLLGITFHLGGRQPVDRGVPRSNNNNSNLECCRMFLHRPCDELLRARCAPSPPGHLLVS